MVHRRFFACVIISEWLELAVIEACNFRVARDDALDKPCCRAPNVFNPC
jgi:hypothetical protein